MSTATIKADKVGACMARIANSVILARLHAQTEREKMEAVDLDLIDWLAPVDRYTGKPITKPKDTWTMRDEDAATYYAERTKRIAAMGYKLPDGYCPALCAEEVVRIAERNMVDAAGEFFPNVDADSLICLGLEKYRQFVELLLKLGVNHPSYQRPRL